MHLVSYYSVLLLVLFSYLSFVSGKERNLGGSGDFQRIKILLSKMKKIYTFIICLLVPQLAGILGSIFTAGSVETWYVGVERSVLTPPNWVFAPVWTLLFFLMGIALYIVWQQKNLGALVLFAVQLVLNTLWSIIFFGLQDPAFALVEIVVLWFFILLTTMQFFRVRKVAGLLLVPYVLWVSFAMYLNFIVWYLN